MASLAPSHRISADSDYAELHFAIGGFWTRAAMEEFLTELARAAVPFMKAKRDFSALGDLSQFVPQDRETAAAIRDSLMQGTQNGLKRFAVVSTSSLVQMQYRRITDGIEVGFFDDIRSAEKWLRA